MAYVKLFTTLLFTQNEAAIDKLDYEMYLGASNHYVIVHEYKMELKELNRPRDILRKTRDYRHGDYSKVRDFLIEVHWGKGTRSEDDK